MGVGLGWEKNNRIFFQLNFKVITWERLKLACFVLFSFFGFLIGGQGNNNNTLSHKRVVGLEMAQWLGALTALWKVLSSVPSTHMVVHNCLYSGV